jgi:hypothetical protein
MEALRNLCSKLGSVVHWPWVALELRSLSIKQGQNDQYLVGLWTGLWGPCAARGTQQALLVMLLGLQLCPVIPVRRAWMFTAY